MIETRETLKSPSVSTDRAGTTLSLPTRIMKSPPSFPVTFCWGDPSFALHSEAVGHMAGFEGIQPKMHCPTTSCSLCLAVAPLCQLDCRHNALFCTPPSRCQLKHSHSRLDASRAVCENSTTNPDVCVLFRLTDCCSMVGKSALQGARLARPAD